MPIPSSSSSPPQPLTAGSSSWCSEWRRPECSRPYPSSLNSDVGPSDSVVVEVIALDGVAVAPVDGDVVVDVDGPAGYQLICFWPTSGTFDPLARPCKDDKDNNSTAARSGLVYGQMD
jgi:hypothetical protein